MDSFTKLPIYMKIILIIFALAILGILIYTLVSVVSVNKKIKELDTKTGEARIKSLIDKFTEKQQERDVSTDSQDIQANNINVRENLTSRNIDVSENLSADTITASGKIIANEFEANNINVRDNTNVKNLNISGNISSNDLIEKIKEHSDKYVRYLEVDLTDQGLYNKEKFYPLVFASRNSGQIKVVEFTISSYSGMLQLTNPQSLEKSINQNLLKFTGQGGGFNADRSFAEIYYTFYDDKPTTNSNFLFSGKTFGPIVSAKSSMSPLIDIENGKTIPLNVCLYVRGCNKYYIRTNSDNVNLMNKGGRITNTSSPEDGCFINVLEITRGDIKLLDADTKETPIYNTETVIKSQNLNPGLELFWDGMLSSRGKFFYSEGEFNMGIPGDIIVNGSVSNNQTINLNYGDNFKSVKLDSSGNIPITDFVTLYKCDSSTVCDTNISTTPTIFKSIKFEPNVKPSMSKISYYNNNLNGILKVFKTGFYELDINLLFFVILNNYVSTNTSSGSRMNRLQVPPAITIKLADITTFNEKNEISSTSSPDIVSEFICVVNNSFTTNETPVATEIVPKINGNGRIFSGFLRETRVVNLLADRLYSFIILRPNSDVYKLKYGTDININDRGILLHKVSNININFLRY